MISIFNNDSYNWALGIKHEKLVCWVSISKRVNDDNEKCMKYANFIYTLATFRNVIVLFRQDLHLENILKILIAEKKNDEGDIVIFSISSRWAEKARRIADVLMSDDSLTKFIWKIAGSKFEDIDWVKHICGEEKIRLESLANDEDSFWATGEGTVSVTLMQMKKRGNDNSINFHLNPISEMIYGRRFSSVCKVNDFIYIFPDFGANIIQYEINNNTWKTIKNIENKEDVRGFRVTVAYMDKIYALPYSLPYIAVIDTRNDTCDFIETKPTDRNLGPVDDSAYITNGYKDTDVYTFYSRAYNSILMLNFKTNSISTIKDFGDSVRMSAVAFLDDCVYMTPEDRSQTIIKYNFKDDSLIEIFQGNNVEMIDFAYTIGCVSGEKVFFLPGTSNHVICFNTKTNMIHEIKEFNETIWEKGKWKFTFAYTEDDYLYAFDGFTDTFVLYSLVDKKIEKHKLSVTEIDRYRCRINKMLIEHGRKDISAFQSGQIIHEG